MVNMEADPYKDSYSFHSLRVSLHHAVNHRSGKRHSKKDWQIEVEEGRATRGIEKTQRGSTVSSIDENPATKTGQSEGQSVNEKMAGSRNQSPHVTFGKGSIEENGRKRSKDAKKPRHQGETQREKTPGFGNSRYHQAHEIEKSQSRESDTAAVGERKIL